MKKSFKLATGMALVAALSACGGGDDNDGGGSPVDNPPPAAPLTVKQGQWLGYESAANAVNLPVFGILISEASLSTAQSGTLQCTAPQDGAAGTVTNTYTDTDHNNVLSPGDTATLVFSNCVVGPGAQPTSGTLQIVFKTTDGIAGLLAGQGDVTRYDLKTEVTGQKGFVYNGQSLEGTLTNEIVYDNQSTPNDSSDDIYTFETDAASLALSYSVNNAVVSNEISNFVAKLDLTGTANATLKYTGLSYDLKGNDSLLGSYAGKVSLVSPIAISNFDGVASVTGGALKTDLGSEYVTTTFAGNPVTVTFLSSKGTTSMLGIDDFLKLQP
jgi:hypothetical protein